MDLQGSLDDEIEVNFSISPAIRTIRYHDPDQVRLMQDLVVMHVSPSIDANVFHDWMLKAIVLDGVVPAKQTTTLNFVAKRGWYSVSCFAVHALAFIVAREEGPSEIDLELLDGQMRPAEAVVKMGPVRINLHNSLGQRMPFGLTFLGDDNDEHPAPNYTIRRFLNGKRVLTSQTFRDLFKAETLDVGTGMEIKNLTVLFTDLQASTAMYERVGDLKALDIVQRHFQVLQDVIARHRGAVVKTIGDAVMAVFQEPDKAMAAATQMIDNVRRAAGHGEDLVLKIGLHEGSCITIQSNNQIDYFGRTVNIASRVQSLADGGQIVCSETVWNAPGVQDRARERNLTVRKETAALKGIGNRFAVRRIIVAADAGSRKGRTPVAKRPTARKAAHRGKAGRAGKAMPARAKAKSRARAS